MKTATCLLLLALTLGCQSSAQRITQLYGGPDAMAALRAPDKLEAWRTIAPFAVKDGIQTQGKLSDYLILRGPVPVDTETGAAIAAILQRNIYEWNMAKGCEPTPGVAVQFTKGADRVLIFFCFECDILLTYFNNQRISGEDFDTAHRALADLARKIFPNDPALKDI